MKPKTFDEVRNYLSGISAINAGGCGISALAMALWVKKNEKQDVQFTFCYRRTFLGDYATNKRLLKCNQSLLVPQHVVILYKHRRYDCNGKIPSDKYKYSHRVSLNTLINTVNDIYSWNDAFDRDNVKNIERKLNIKLPIEKD